MSTSKGWVIWVEDFLKKFDGDLLRYYMVINAPLNKRILTFHGMTSKEE